MQATPAAADNMDTTVDWEWALVTDITDEARTEGQIACADNWTAFNECQEEDARLVRGFPPEESLSDWAMMSFFIIDLPAPTPEGYNLVRCHRPEPTKYGVGAFDLRPFLSLSGRGQLEVGPHARVLVRATPAARLLSAALSETTSTIEIAFSSLTGNQLGVATRSKDEGLFLMEDLVELAMEVAKQENLLTSVNQKLWVLLDGYHHEIPPAAVLWSASDGQESSFAGI